MRSESVRALIPLAGGIGLILSIYAAIEVVFPSAANICSVSSFVSCARVATSGKTTILGVPDWVIGLLGFVGTLVLYGIAERTRELRWDSVLLGWTTIGVGVSFYLLYVELAEINAFCLICAGAYIANFVVWVAALLLVGKKEWDDLERPEESDETGKDTEGDRATERVDARPGSEVMNFPCQSLSFRGI